MNLPAKLSTALLVLTILTPTASAKIYPDDFMLWDTRDTTATPTPPHTSIPVPPPTISMASPIPSGRLTRGQFIDAIATRLYDSHAHATCFGDLVGKTLINYRLLFNDVSVGDRIATSVCVMMKSGVVRGSGGGNLSPGRLLTAAEAATVFARLTGAPMRAPKAHEAWYQRSMEAMRSIDREFTFRPGDIITGPQLQHMMCVLKRSTPQIDPLGEFEGC